MKKNKLDKVEKLLEEGKLQEAKALCRREITKHKTMHDAWHLMGVINNELGSYPEAEYCFQRVITLQPKSAEAYYNLGKCLEIQNKLEKSEMNFVKATQLNPSFAFAFNNLGVVQTKLFKFEEAGKNLQCSIELQPNYATAYFNLGKYFDVQNKLEEAENNYLKATKLNPVFAFAFNNLGVIQTKLNKIEEAFENLQYAVKIAPNLTSAKSFILAIMNYSNRFSRQEIHEAHKRWEIKHNAKQQFNLNNSPVPNKRLRIGYISPDFCKHPVAFFFESLLEHKNSEAFKVFCYSDVKHPDDMTEQLKQLSHHWRHCSGLPDETVAEMIQSDEIDILIDLAGHTEGNRLTLFAKRVAPVQVSYLGYPNTTGLTEMDYLVTDHFLDPDEESHKYYKEKLLYLPNSFFCYKPRANYPEVASAPFIKNDYITFGSYNKLTKTDEEVIALWSEVLRAVPNSRLIIQTSSLNFPHMQEKYENLFLANHISLDRIDLLSSSTFNDYMAGHANVDILLDTFPWNGHTVSCHALWMGVPFITLAQDKRSSRMGLSILKNLGLDSCIAFNKEQYVNCAKQLAEDRPQLDTIRKNLRERMKSSALCNGQQFTQDFEVLLRSVWHSWCEQQSTQA